MGSFKAVTAKALVDAGAGAPLITCVPHADQEVAGWSAASGLCFVLWPVFCTVWPV